MGNRETKENPQERQTQENEVRFVDLLPARTYSTDLQQREEERSPKQNYNVSRELIGQLTPSRPVQGNLFSILAPEELSEDAKLYEEQGKLFSIITDGINAGVVGKKAVLYIARELYRQASIFAKDGDPIRHGFSGIIEHAREQGFYSERKVGSAIMPSIFIRVKLSEATKWIKGTNQTKNRNAIDDIIHRLSSNIVFWKSPDNNRHLKVNVISIEAEYTNEATKQKEYLLEVKPLFYSSIAKGYITASESSTRLLPNLQQEIEINLFLYILELHSFKGVKGYPVIKRIKDKVDARVIPSHYINGSKKKRLKEDFNKAITEMIRGGLLTDEGITTELGRDGVTFYYVFHLNPHYNDTTTPLPPPEK